MNEEVSVLKREHAKEINKILQRYQAARDRWETERLELAQKLTKLEEEARALAERVIDQQIENQDLIMRLNNSAEIVDG